MGRMPIRNYSNRLNTIRTRLGMREKQNLRIHRDNSTTRRKGRDDEIHSCINRVDSLC